MTPLARRCMENPLPPLGAVERLERLEVLRAIRRGELELCRELERELNRGSGSAFRAWTADVAQPLTVLAIRVLENHRKSEEAWQERKRLGSVGRNRKGLRKIGEKGKH